MKHIVEYRYDMDGFVYSKKEFFDYYNGFHEWNNAEYSHTWYSKKIKKDITFLKKRVKKLYNLICEN